MVTKIMKCLVCLLAVFPVAGGAANMVHASVFATSVVEYSGPFGGSPYDDPGSVLGKPTTWIKGDDVGGYDMACSMVYPAWNTSPAPEYDKLITTLNTDAYITVEFDHAVENDPLNPFGIDFIVYGNSFFIGTGEMVYADTNMENYHINTGAIFSEPITVSVSPDLEEWYTYTLGPYGDDYFPTNAFAWDRDADEWGAELDWTKPVDPTLTASDFAGLSVADAIDLYDGSAGGTGFDLAESGFEWIKYIKVENLYAGEIDGFSDVAAVPVPAAVWLLGSGLIGVIGIRRKTATTEHTNTKCKNDIP